jgi:hypothetical protein
MTESLVQKMRGAADDAAFREIYARIARALFRHHEATGIELKPGLWKIYLSPEACHALKVYARRLRQPSIALEVYANVNRIGGFDILPDPNLTGDQIVLRTEIWA